MRRVVNVSTSNGNAILSSLAGGKLQPFQYNECILYLDTHTPPQILHTGFLQNHMCMTCTYIYTYVYTYVYVSMSAHTY